MTIRFNGKLRKQFRDTQRVSFMLEKTRKPPFPNWDQKNFFWEKSHSVENPKHSAMLAERFASSKKRGVLIEAVYFEKVIWKKRQY